MGHLGHHIHLRHYPKTCVYILLGYTKILIEHHIILQRYRYPVLWSQLLPQLLNFLLLGSDGNVSRSNLTYFVKDCSLMGVGFSFNEMV